MRDHSPSFADRAVLHQCPLALFAAALFSTIRPSTATPVLALIRNGQGSAQKVAPLPTESALELNVPAPQLTPGSYELRYRVISADGHIMAGSVHFTVAGH